DVVDDLLDQQPKSNGPPNHDAHATEPSKKMQRTRFVLQKESNGHQIEQDPKSARDAIVRLATLAIHVVDGNLADRGSIGGSDRRYKTMHLSVQWQPLQNFAAIGFE